MAMTMNSTADMVLAQIWKRHRPEKLADGSSVAVPDAAGVPSSVPTGAVQNINQFNDVPMSPASPPEKYTMGGKVAEGAVFDRAGEWEERAAIIEFDGGFSRVQAEWRATAEMGYRPGRGDR